MAARLRDGPPSAYRRRAGPQPGSRRRRREPGLADLAGGRQPGQQRAHRLAFVGEHPDIALRAAQGQRPGQGLRRGVLVAAGGQGQRLQRADLDEAAGPVLGGRRGEHFLHERERLSRALFGEQHPGQDQVLPFARVARFVDRAQASFSGPLSGASDVALGQQQPRPLRGDRVEQAGDVRASAARPASPIASSAPPGSPRACRIQARVTRPVPSGAGYRYCRHSAMPSVTCRRAPSRSFRW